MHIAFFHERFLFRFGHDRTMMLHGRELVRRGHRVTFVGYRGDKAVIERLGASLVLLPQSAPSWGELDEFSARALRERWAGLFSDGAPDVVVNGGWPFYAATEVLAELGVPSVYFDAGATPLDGVPPEDLPVHRKLRFLRRWHIGSNAATVSVSRFIASSQTLSDAPDIPNAVVHNGVDHVDEPLWTLREVSDAEATRVEDVVARARKGARRMLLHLGRWEEGYKNKAGAAEVLRKLVAAGPDVSLVVLAKGDPALPADLRGRVVFAGHPDDVAMRRLMLEADAGYSMSLWEGFNLPLGEMHYLGRPAYVLDAGAHAEVAASPEFVCTSAEEMAGRLAALLEPGTRPVLPEELVREYRERFAWSRAAAELETVLTEAAASRARGRPVKAVVVDVTNACRDTANSGVVRVTRRVTRELLDMALTIAVVWDEPSDDYRLPTASERERLASYGGPSLPDDAPVGLVPLDARLKQAGLSLQDTVLFCPETILHARAARITAWTERNGVDVAAVLHDLIPLSHPEYCDSAIVEAFPAYLQFLARARLLIPNSAFTAARWRQHAPADASPSLAVETLPGDFGPRSVSRPAGDGVRRLLTVSTLEPRKNHAVLLDAFEAAQRAAPELRLELHLVGNGYEGAESVLERARARAAANPAIVLHGVVDDDRLAALYEQADFTVYPSVVEGFGLPVLESVWRGRPFICHREGSMAEIAAPGGGVTCDMTSPGALTEAILELARDPELRETLALAASVRPVRRWRDYARACLDHMLEGRGPRRRGAAPRASKAIGLLRRPESAGRDWNALLYPGKPIDHWQMSDAERMSLTGLLARWRPRSYLEIGVYHGGSTLLAAEFAERVTSIDIDPEAINRFDKPENVRFVAGSSVEVLPALLTELAAEDGYPDFVLIDGDHSAKAVKRDVEMILQRQPPRPMLVVFHDSFNPECRQGIVAADWCGSPWAWRLELDFVAGGIVEHHGDPNNGQMWGGLAVGLLLPEPRPGDFELRAALSHTYERALAQARSAA